MRNRKKFISILAGFLAVVLTLGLLAGVLPRTGDTFALRRWLMIMNLSGILLLVCGCLQKRKSR